MKVIADALVYAVTYISLRSGGGESDDDDDVGALESIGGELASASEAERDALALAAKRALAAERKGPRRPEFIREYGAWMENLFGDEWAGNKRQ